MSDKGQTHFAGDDCEGGHLSITLAELHAMALEEPTAEERASARAGARWFVLWVEKRVRERQAALIDAVDDKRTAAV